MSEIVIFTYSDSPLEHPRSFIQKFFNRNLRKEKFQDYDAIVFVVDAADKASLPEAKEELWKFLGFAPDFMDHAVLLVMANKQDVAGAAHPEDLIKYLSLGVLPRTTQYKVQATSGLDGRGLAASLDWLSRTIKENRRKSVTETYL